jgi:phage-related protein
MDEKTCVAYKGLKFTVEWYFEQNGESKGFDFFLKSNREQRRKLFILIKRIGDFGLILNKTKFVNEGDGIYAFKPQPDRYLSFFTNNRKIIITNGFRKKTDKMPKSEKLLALKYRNDYFARISGGT